MLLNEKCRKTGSSLSLTCFTCVRYFTSIIVRCNRQGRDGQTDGFTGVGWDESRSQKESDETKTSKEFDESALENLAGVL